LNLFVEKSEKSVSKIGKLNFEDTLSRITYAAVSVKEKYNFRKTPKIEVSGILQCS
jgi:hypothetical protein